MLIFLSDVGFNPDYGGWSIYYKVYEARGGAAKIF